MALTGNFKLALPGHTVDIAGAYVRLDAIQFDKRSNYWGGLASVYASESLVRAVTEAEAAYIAAQGDAWPKPADLVELEVREAAALSACQAAGAALDEAEAENRADPTEENAAAERAASNAFGVALAQSSALSRQLEDATATARSLVESATEVAYRSAVEACQPLTQIQVASPYDARSSAHELLYAALKLRPELAGMVDA